AILGHGTYTGVPRDTAMARTLFAVDELCGFLVACALVRPSRSFADLEVSSVKKKLKDKGFARGVNRDEVNQGAAELGVPLDEHVAFVIRALRPAEVELGLGGQAAVGCAFPPPPRATRSPSPSAARRAPGPSTAIASSTTPTARAPWTRCSLRSPRRAAGCTS